MWVVTIGLTSKAESDCWSRWVEIAEGAGREVYIGGGGFAKKLVQVPHMRLWPRIWEENLYLCC